MSFWGAIQQAGSRLVEEINNNVDFDERGEEEYEANGEQKSPEDNSNEIRRLHAEVNQLQEDVTVAANQSNVLKEMLREKEEELKNASPVKVVIDLGSELAAVDAKQNPHELLEKNSFLEAQLHKSVEEMNRLRKKLSNEGGDGMVDIPLTNGETTDEVPSGFSDLLDNLHTLQKANASLQKQLSDAQSEQQSSSSASGDVKVLEAALKRSKQAVAKLVQEKELLMQASQKNSDPDVESVRAEAEKDFMEMRAANQQLAKKNAELESAVKDLTASLEQAKQKEDDLVEEFESTRVWNEGELSDAKDANEVLAKEVAELKRSMKELSAIVNQSKQVNQKLKKEKEELAESVWQLEESLEEARAQRSDDVDDDHRDAAPEVSALARRKSSPRSSASDVAQQSEIVRLKTLAEELTSSKSSLESSVSELTSSLRRLEAENAELNAAREANASSLAQAKDNLKKLMESLDGFKEQNATLAQEKESLSSSVEDLKQKSKILEDQNVQLKESFESSKLGYDSVVGENAQLKQTLQELETEHERTKASLESTASSAGDETKELKERVDSLNAKLKKAKLANEDLSSQRKALQRQVEELSQSEAALSKKHQTLVKKEANLRKLNSGLIEKQTKLTAANRELERSLAEARSASETFAYERDAIDETVQRLEQALKAARGRLYSEEGDPKATSSAAAPQVDASAKPQLNRDITMRDSRHMQKLMAQKLELSGKLKKVTDQKEDLEASNSKLAADLRDSEAACDNLRDEMEALSAAAKSLRDSQASVSDLSSQVEKLSAEKEELESTVTELTAATEKARASDVQLREENEATQLAQQKAVLEAKKLQSLVQEHVTKAEKLERDNNELKSFATQLENSLLQSNEAVQASQQKVMALEKEKSSLGARLEDLESAKHETSREGAAIAQEKHMWEEKARGLESTVKSLEEKATLIPDLEAKCTTLANENASLTSQVEKLTVSGSDLGSAADTLREQNASLNSTVAELSRKLQEASSAQSDNGSLRESLVDMQQRLQVLSKTREENESLRSSVTELTHKLHSASHLQGENESLRSSVTELTQQLQSASHLQGENESLRSSVATLTQQLQSTSHVQGENESMRSSLKELSQKLQQVMAQNESVVNEKEDLRLSTEKLRASLVEAQNSLKERDTSQEMTSIREKAEIAQSQYDSLLERVTQMQKEARDAQDVEERLKKALADAQRECGERQRELDAKAQEILKMQEALQHERMESLKTLQEEQEVSDKLQAEIRGYKATIENLHLKLRDTVRDQASFQAEQDDTLLDVKRDFERQQAENRQLKFQLQKLRSAQRDAEIEAQQAMEAVRNEMTSLRANSDDFNSLSQEYHDLKKVHQDTTRELSEQTVALERMEAAWHRTEAESKAKIAHLERKLAEKEQKSQIALDKGCSVVEFERVKSELGTVRKDFMFQQKYSLKLKTENHSLRRSLHQTLRQLSSLNSDENQVDRRLVNKLLVTYFERRSSASAQPEEVLELMNRILRFDDNEQRLMKVGKYRQQAQGWTSWAASWVAPEKTSPADAKAAGSSSLADSWVDFLLQEAEGGRANFDMTSDAASTTQSFMGISLDTFSDAGSVAASTGATSPKTSTAASMTNPAVAQNLSSARAPPPAGGAAQASPLTAANIAAHTSSVNSAPAPSGGQPPLSGGTRAASLPPRSHQLQADQSFGAAALSAASRLNTSTVSAPGLSTVSSSASATAGPVSSHARDFRTPPVKYRSMGFASADPSAASSSSHLAPASSSRSRSGSTNILSPAQPSHSGMPATFNVQQQAARNVEPRNYHNPPQESATAGAGATNVLHTHLGQGFSPNPHAQSRQKFSQKRD